MIRLTSAEQPPLEYVIPDGQLEGCRLYLRRPTYGDEVASFMTSNDAEWMQARAKLIEAWKGKGEDPSPFCDERGSPVGFSQEAFQSACVTCPELLRHAYVAIIKLFAREGDAGKSEGQSTP